MRTIHLPVIEIAMIEDGSFNIGRNLHFNQVKPTSQKTIPFKVPLASSKEPSKKNERNQI